ncbi:amino acid ABC transporter permease, partial [Clostridium saudiense]|nr:amino acid ABC transporter permease [Clostridium saudiense]
MIAEIFNKTNLLFLLDGIKLTLLIAITTIIIS